MTEKEGGLFVNKREKGNKQKQEKVCEKKKCTHKRSLSLFFSCSQCTYKKQCS